MLTRDEPMSPIRSVYRFLCQVTPLLMQGACSGADTVNRCSPNCYTYCYPDGTGEFSVVSGVVEADTCKSGLTSADLLGRRVHITRGGPDPRSAVMISVEGDWVVGAGSGAVGCDKASLFFDAASLGDHDCAWRSRKESVLYWGMPPSETYFLRINESRSQPTGGCSNAYDACGVTYYLKLRKVLPQPEDRLASRSLQMLAVTPPERARWGGIAHRFLFLSGILSSPPAQHNIGMNGLSL